MSLFINANIGLHILFMREITFNLQNDDTVLLISTQFPNTKYLLYHMGFLDIYCPPFLAQTLFEFL